MRASAIVFLTAACGCATWTARDELPPVAPISSGDESLFSIITEEEQRLLHQPETHIGR